MFKKSSYLFAVSFLFSLPAFVALAVDEGYSLLAPVPTVTTSNPGLVVYLKGMFTIFVGLGFIAAVVMIILGAMEYIMAGVPSAKSGGKEKMEQALVGLLVLLVSTILLNTINPDLLRVGIKLDKVTPSIPVPWVGGGSSGIEYCQALVGGTDPDNYLSCYFSMTACQAVPCSNGIPFSCHCVVYDRNANKCTSCGGGGGGGGEGGASGNEQGNRDFLSGKGITVNAPSPKTILSGVRQTTLNETARLKMTCDCTVVVTAGSEDGHASGTYSHANGYKVDLRLDSSLTNFIKNNYTNIGKRGDGAQQYKSPTGSIYALESDHWDVLVN